MPRRNHTKVAVELGAGTARLSERLQRVTHARLRHVLVDRESFKAGSCRDLTMRKFRNRAETQLAQRQQQRRQEQPSPCPSADKITVAPDSEAVTRVVGDIAQFKFDDYSHFTTTTTPADQQEPATFTAATSNKSSHSPYICLSKHLCGPACDLAFRSMVQV